MKTEIHPKYYPNAEVICSCGAKWTTGSTTPVIRTDVCSQCHPFFTGEQRIVDTAGQVDRFMKRLGEFSKHQTEAEKRQAQLLKKMEQRFVKQQLAALDLGDEVTQVLHDATIMNVGDLEEKVTKDQAGLLKLKGFNADLVGQLTKKVTEARASYFANL